MKTFEAIQGMQMTGQNFGISMTEIGLGQQHRVAKSFSVTFESRGPKLIAFFERLFPSSIAWHMAHLAGLYAVRKARRQGKITKAKPLPTYKIKYNGS